MLPAVATKDADQHRLSKILCYDFVLIIIGSCVPAITLWIYPEKETAYKKLFSTGTCRASAQRFSRL